MQTAYRCIDDLIRQLRQGATLQEALNQVRLFKFLILGTEWASGNGGLSTFNRKLCISLAKLGHEVVLYLSSESAVPGANNSSEDSEAASLGVTLLRANGAWRDDVPVKVKALQPDFVIGHDRHSGDAAQKLQRDYFQSAKNILFIHTDPAIEMFKGDNPIKRGEVKERKESIQRMLMKGADIVAAVGPRLHRHCVDVVHGFKANLRPALVEFVPGFDAREESPRADTIHKLIPPKALLIGRAEDAKLKGLDIFRIAVEKLELERLLARPNVVGAPIEEISRLYLEDDFGRNGDALGYSSDPERIEEHFRSSYFAVMPSREEGFGLVALEALEANRPIVVSARSGFAEWLIREIEQRAPELAPAARNCIFLIPPRQPDDDECSLLSKLADSLAVPMRRLLLDYPSSVEEVRQIREALMPLDWMFRSAEFVAQLPSAGRPPISATSLLSPQT